MKRHRQFHQTSKLELKLLILLIHTTCSMIAVADAYLELVLLCTSPLI